MPKATRRRYYLSTEDQTFLAALVTRRGLTGAAREIDLPRQSVATLLLPEEVGGVTAGLHALARERIAAARAVAASAPSTPPRAA